MIAKCPATCLNICIFGMLSTKFAASSTSKDLQRQLISQGNSLNLSIECYHFFSIHVSDHECNDRVGKVSTEYLNLWEFFHLFQSIPVQFLPPHTAVPNFQRLVCTFSYIFGNRRLEYRLVIPWGGNAWSPPYLKNGKSNTILQFSRPSI